VSVNHSISAPALPVKRRSTGKRLRFEVFKRDLFTCRYCGAQPPEVVLVVDHVLSVAEGGATSLDNLVTACEPCNQGKSHKGLGDASPRIDADLQYLEVQQELAELRRYQRVLAERDEAITEMVDSLQNHWCAVSGLDWCPSDLFVRQLLMRFPPEIVGDAFEDVGVKVSGGYVKDNTWDRYLWVVCRTMAAERGEVA